MYGCPGYREPGSISVSTIPYLVCMAVLVTGSLVLLVLALYTVPCMYGCPGYREPGSISVGTILYLV